MQLRDSKRESHDQGGKQLQVVRRQAKLQGDAHDHIVDNAAYDHKEK